MAIIPADEKVFMVDKRTNTTYGGSQALQDMQQWYTMQDVADSVQPYKVFTALLTQSGEDSPANVNYDNQVPLVIGQSYFIDDNDPLVDGGTDFTNVGAPSNNVGTYFIATGTTPIWGTANGFLIYNEGAPVATVLENTIGNIWFNYQAQGEYQAVSTNSFPELKTYLYIQPASTPDEGSITTYYSGVSSIQITTLTTPPYTVIDGKLYNTSFEIRVYN